MRFGRRWGRFRITGELLAESIGDGDLSPNLMVLFGQMIIIRANEAPHIDEIHYMATSPLFDEIEEGGRIPWYEIEFERPDDDDGELVVRARRTDEVIDSW